MRHIIGISGKDSLATAIVQVTHEPTLPYEMFFNDVKAELPETYEWLGRVEKKLGVKIHRVGKSLEDIIRGFDFLPSPKARFCTRVGKIEPLEDWIGDDEAILYLGIRADEDRVGYQPTKNHKIAPKYPLKEMGIDLKTVFTIVDNYNLRPPKFFWKKMYDTVLKIMKSKYNLKIKIGKSPQEILSSLPSWFFDTLFAWRSRPNCSFCFFQNPWEWVGLLEHHSDLFEKAKSMEEEIGLMDDGRKFTWNQDYPLLRIMEEREKIIDKRARKIIKMIDTTRIRPEDNDVLGVTSCGLFCGK